MPQRPLWGAVAELNRNIHAGHLPLHVAIEYSVPGAIFTRWNGAGIWEVVELLLLTRPNVLIDYLADLPTTASFGLEAHVITARSQLAHGNVYVDGIFGWIRSILNASSPAGSGASAKRLRMRENAELKIWQAVRDLGPPTLDEIVRAAEARADR